MSMTRRSVASVWLTLLLWTLLSGLAGSARAENHPGYAELSGPLMLQDHIPNGGPMTVMRFRNIWFRAIHKAK